MAGQQEGTEPAFLRRDRGDGVAFQQPREKFLREVLGVFGRITAPPHVGVERMPVGLAKIFERGAGAGGVAASRRQHHRPVRGDKYRPRRRVDFRAKWFPTVLLGLKCSPAASLTRTGQSASLLNLGIFLTSRTQKPSPGKARSDIRSVSRKCNAI